MIKSAIKYHSVDMPSWAKNYLAHYNVFDMMLIMKPMARHKVFAENLLKGGLLPALTQEQLGELEKTIYFNKKGDVVFMWKSKGHQDMFVVKWG